MDEAENKIDTKTVQGLAQGNNPQVTMNYYGQGPPLASPPGAWNIPRRNPLFTGRDDLLCRLHDTFAQTQTQVISGLGGIGKTQIAIEYAHRYHDEYRYAFWVNASREAIITSFLELAMLLNLPERDQRDQNVIVAAVKGWCANHDGWLLIFDNADDLALMEDFLPSGGRGHLLLTTHNQAFGRLGNAIEVEKLDESEGILLLLWSAGVLEPKVSLEQASAADHAVAQTIVQDMAGLPWPWIRLVPTSPRPSAVSLLIWSSTANMKQTSCNDGGTQARSILFP